MTLVSTSFDCRFPSSSSGDYTVDRFLIETLAALTKQTDSLTLSEEAADVTCVAPVLVTTTTNLWAGTTVRSTASVGSMGILHALSPSWLHPSHRSWMDSLSDGLLTVLRGGSDESNESKLQALAEDFITSVDAHLQRTANTYLEGGESATLSDIVVALCMALYAKKHVLTFQLPEQAHRLTVTVAGKLADCIGNSSKNIGKALKEFTALPAGESKPVPIEVAPLVVAEVPSLSGTETGTAPAAAAVATTTTKAAASKKTDKKSESKSVPAPATATAAPAVAPSADAASSSSSSGEPSDTRIMALLKQHNIAFAQYDHPACMTAEELVQNVPLPVDDGQTHTHTKNLFLKDKKHGFVLITARPNAEVKTSEIKNYLNLSGKCNFRLATEDLLLEMLQCKPGCVGPLCCSIMPKPKEGETFTLILDKGLMGFDKIHSHPARNDQSVQLAPSALLQFLKVAGGIEEPVMVDFGEAGAPGTAAPAAGKAPATRPPAPAPAPKKEKKEDGGGGGATAAPPAASNKKVVKKGETLLALQWKKSENFPMWYSDVIVLSEMISYYDISGCYILRPWSFKIWELIQDWFNPQIQKLGVENSYFPMFVSQDRLEREKDHVEGFAPEVAWVTKSGSGDLAKPIAVRPTSETVMYPAYSDWIKSHRDLPLKLNQWCNVVRWEFKYPTPFLRTREFLWQEGHTAHATFEDADEMVMQALELYRAVYEDLLAVPVVKGYKTEKEKFAGGYRTTTVEAYIAGSGRAIQGATSHNLGQNFGKMFDIKFQNEKGESQIVWQTSWGLTTRTIGVMVMVHGDDQGLVLPPRVAPLQIVIVPIVSKKLLAEDAAPYCLSILEDLEKNGIRCKYDDRAIYNPGWKYNHWEQKGVPIRIEVGPNDIEKKCARIVIRHDGMKEDLPIEGLGQVLAEKLKEIQSTMFNKAKAARDSHVVKITEWKDFVPNLEKHNLVLTPWCGGEHQEWEEWVKTTSRDESLKALGEEGEDEQTSTSVAAKTLCIPFDQPELPPGTKCIASGMDATCWVLWGRSY